MNRSPFAAIEVLLIDGNNLPSITNMTIGGAADYFAALKFKGYDHTFEYGVGAHTHFRGGAILPDSLRWLWRDWRESGK